MIDTTEQVVEQPAPDAIEPEQTETPVEEQAESSPAVTDADESPDQKPKPKGKGIQDRIDELTRNWREAERREAALMAMLERQHSPAKPDPVIEEKPKPTPKLEDFNYDEAAYQAALFQHVKDEAARVARAELQQERAREQEQAKKQTFRQRETDFSKENPDYLAVTRDPSLPFTRELVELTSESEKGPEILYHLAKNRDLAERIAGLSPVAAAREIGRLEAKFEKPASAPKPAVSKAPPPPPRIEATEPEVEKDESKMTDTEWYQRQKRLRNLKQFQSKR
jgi:hypothetical protein